MARIKVLEVVEAAAGGVMRHVFQIAEHIDKDEFDVTVAISPARMVHPERDLRRLRDLDARVEMVPMLRRPAPVSDLAALRRLVRLMRREKYDVVHAHSSKAGFLGRLAARRAGIERVFYTPHAFAFQCGGAVGWMYRQLERIGAIFGGAIVAVSESERELVLKAGIVRPGRVRVIRNAIEAPPLPTPEDGRQAREKLGLPQGAPVVGSVGRLAPQKGLGYLVRAAAHVCGERDGVRFVLIGGGPLEPRLRGLAERLGIAHRVVFAGHRDDAADLYAAMDIYVQASLWEGLPYALLDAMGRGLPAVATDLPGNSDVVKGGATGLLVAPRDPAALAGAILDLLDNGEERRELGDAARDLVLREHNAAGFIASVEALYRGD
ncbi:MAG: glycosyltransferase family 4 protein [Planctomycetota bacterium]